MNENTHLKIIRLEASNIKRLKAINVDVEGKPVVIISGLNDSGKTSTLDSISFALGGKDMIDAVPIRTGASKAKVVVDLKEFKVTRSFSALGGSTLTIEDATGNLVRSPQTLLDKLCSRIAFDPLSFVREKPDKQLETLRKLVGLDFTILDSKRKTAYDERTIANRELASAKARAAECEVDPETPDEEVSVSALLTEVAEVQTYNQENAKRRQEASQSNVRAMQVENEIKLKNGEAEGIESQIVRLQKAKEALISDAAQLTGIFNERKKVADALNDEALKLKDKDAAPIHAKINEAGTINAKVRDKKNYAKLQKEVTAVSDKVQKLADEIEAFDKEKTDQLSTAKFPLEGLSFDDTGVLLNGVPFTQGSQARQLQAAVAIGIAMNPTVRVILIRDGSLLDPKSLAMVAEMAEKSDCQVWIEIVDSKDPAAILIEDGSVKEVIPEEVASE